MILTANLFTVVLLNKARILCGVKTQCFMPRQAWDRTANNPQREVQHIRGNR